MFIMRKYEMLGLFIISLISIALGIFFWAMPSTFITDGIGPSSDSLWQIGKLMFVSILIYTIIEYSLFGREFDNFIFAKSATLFLAPLIYISLSYIMDLGIGSASFNNHIVTYAIALGLGQYISYYILSDGYYFKFMNQFAIISIIIMITIYISFGKITDNFNAPFFKKMERYQTYIGYQ